jgi:stage II sporulation protein D
VRNSSNEADGESADQPRLHLPSSERPRRAAAGPAGRGLLIAAMPVLAVLVAVIAICASPEVHEPPPPLQTFARATAKVPAVPPLRRQTKSEEPVIRVNVTPGGVDSFQLEIRGGCELTSLETSSKFPPQAISGTFTVSSTKAGLKLGAQQYATKRLEILPAPSPAIRVNGHLYRGRMRLFRRADGKVSAVNVLPIEEYLASVVDSEMPAKFPEEARHAQAIVARTYALYQMQQADPNSVYDLLSSQRSQKYLGFEYLNGAGRKLAGESASSRKVIEATRGVVCQSRGKLFSAYYSAVCGGRTTNGVDVFKDADEVLKSVTCEWCHDSPHYRWTTEIPRDEFEKRVFSLGDTKKKVVAIRAIRQTSESGSGQISRFDFDYGQYRQSIGGIELRERLPSGTLYSPHFQITLDQDRVLFEGRGHGHGVGFCQWGAKGQAESGRKSLDIVRYYFPGAELTVIDY